MYTYMYMYMYMHMYVYIYIYTHTLYLLTWGNHETNFHGDCGVDKGLCHSVHLETCDKWWRDMGEHSFTHSCLTIVY